MKDISTRTEALLPVGMEVGAKRWPYWGAHPGCWTTPLKGVVLAQNDLRAWKGTWYGHSQQAVDAHLEWCGREGLLDETVPVLWTSSAGESFVYWSELADLRPYEDDFKEWLRAREDSLDAMRREKPRCTRTPPAMNLRLVA